MLRKLFTVLMQLVIMTSVLLAASAFADVNDASVKVKWGYKGNKGPSRWAELSPAFVLCSSGKHQSPINIGEKFKKKNSALTIDYHSAPLNIVNDGTTELMIGQMQTLINDGHSVQLNFPNNSEEHIRFNDKDYHLVQFHLHTPSENEHLGEAFPMEIHFVHQGDNGELTVIGVFVRGGKPNQAMQKIIDNLPRETNKVQMPEGQVINPEDLFPAQRDYYSFEGSLTTPPCAESVHWIVFAQPITASPAQILSLRRAAGGANARPTQALNGRSILYSPI